MSFEVSGADNAALQLRVLVGKRREQTKKAVGLAAHAVEAKAKGLLSLTSHKKGTKTPSRPGQPPSLVTGTLKKSVRVRGPRATSGGFEAVVGPTVVYGRIQEFGGMTGRGHRTKLPARPYMRPAVPLAMPVIRRIFKQAWRF